MKRRDFLAEVGRGMLLATVGYEVASDLGLASLAAEEVSDTLTFGSLEPLVCLMQETPADELLPKLLEQIRSGVDLKRLTAAAAMANARTFGGEDYVGFHTMMALSPALRMASEMPAAQQALPVFKVLYRNTSRIQERGGRKQEVLRLARPAAESAGEESVRAHVRMRNMEAAERALASMADRSPEEAFNAVLMAVHDATEVHRVVLPYRAWDLMSLIGKEHALTLLRQSVHYCVQAESWTTSGPWNKPRTLLPKVLEEFKLMGRSPGARQPDDQWVEQLSETIFKSSPEDAAAAAANALAEEFDPAAVGEALTLAANQLVLRDQGRTPRDESNGKPPGSVHGDSIGVHACDSANAWRNMARVANSRNCFASLVLGAYQVAMDRTMRGGDFLNWEPLPIQRHVEQVKSNDSKALLAEAEDAIRANLQGRVSAVTAKYGALGHPVRPMMDLLLRYAVSEDGALHAEKFYRTVSEEFASTRQAFRWRHIVALARVTASEFGRPAPGMAQAKTLLDL